MNLSHQQIAKVLGVRTERVATFWPLLDEALGSLAGDDYSDKVRIAALATIRVECPPFMPIREYGERERFIRLYWDNEHVRALLGNRSLEDAVRYCGRGFIQITGYSNYKLFGDLCGIDLIANPDTALEPYGATALFAAYFHVHKGLTAHANAMDWTRVRRDVNGGTNGLKAFLFLIQMLGLAAGLPEIANSAQAQFKQVRDQESAPKTEAASGSN